MERIRTSLTRFCADPGPWKEERRKSLRRDRKADYEIAAGRLRRHPARRVETHFCYEGNEPDLGCLGSYLYTLESGSHRYVILESENTTFLAVIDSLRS